jgi:hypothetical protein
MRSSTFRGERTNVQEIPYFRFNRRCIVLSPNRHFSSKSLPLVIASQTSRDTIGGVVLDEIPYSDTPFGP